MSSCLACGCLQGLQKCEGLNGVLFHLRRFSARLDSMCPTGVLLSTLLHAVPVATYKG